MLILGLDSAADGCNICVWRDSEVLALLAERMERGQDRRLMPLVLAALEQAGVAFEQLDRIAVTRGPGSFTGLRIGLAAARGLGLALDIPVIGIDRFSIYREMFKAAPRNVLVVLQSKRKELYCRFYGAEASETMMLPPEEIRDFILRHPDTTMVGDTALDNCRGAPEPEILVAARLAAQADMADPDFHPSPLYIRPPDVTMKAPVIKRVLPDQASILAALHKISFGAQAWSDNQIKGSLAQPITDGWMATQNNEPVGFVLCHTISHEVEILTICVHPPHQRRGIGAKLLQEVLHLAAASKSSIYLEVAVDNRAALSLYQKAGFVQTGLRKGYYKHDGGNVDAILLTRYS